MIHWYCHEWDFPKSMQAHKYPYPAALPRQVPKCFQNLLKGQTSLPCICQLFWICRRLTCFPTFVRHRKHFNLDGKNLISGQWKSSDLLLALKGSFPFLWLICIWNYQYLFDKYLLHECITPLWEWDDKSDVTCTRKEESVLVNPKSLTEGEDE